MQNSTRTDKKPAPAHRYERKFVSDLGIKETERILKLNPGMFRTLYPQRRINNIYFDTHDLHHYVSSVEGERERMKVRIRWYGKLFGLINAPVLEIKLKRGEVGKKLSYPLKAFTFDKKTSRESLMKILKESDLPLSIISELKQHIPILVNSYTRKYFISANKAFRVTLDCDLMFIHMKPSHNTYSQKVVNRRQVILEVKYGDANSRTAHHLFNHLPLRLRRNSKYSQGIEAFRL